MAFQLDNATLRDYFAHLGWEQPEPGTLFLFGIRGARPYDAQSVSLTSPTPTNLYDDTIGLGGRVWGLFPATTDPGASYTKWPLNPEGTAHLLTGSYLYQRGLHKRKPALVQAAPVRVRRDRDRDGRPEASEPVYSGMYGLSIHQGGKKSLGVGAWSAGCQVLPTGGPWESFFDLVEQCPQERYRYYLVRGHELAEWVEKQ